MYYSNEDVDKFVSQLKTPGGEAYLKKSAQALGKMLIKDPLQYKTFGVYWWAIKRMLQQYYPDKTAWFMGEYFDRFMYDRAWHGDLFRTVVAGCYHHGQQISITSEHSYEDENGVVRPYTLFDENAGM